MEAMSENMEDELLSIAVIKEGKKVVCGTQDGILAIWDWGEWATFKDRFPGHPQSIDALTVIDNDTLCTGSSDGLIRIVSIQPNNMLGVIGEHGELPIEAICQSRDKIYLATSSHDYLIKFWGVAYLYEEDDDDDTNGNDTGGNEENEMETDDTRARNSFYSGLV